MNVDAVQPCVEEALAGVVATCRLQAIGRSKSVSVRLRQALV